MTTRISQQQLESYLWGAATLLRGTIDAGDYKQFIFPLLFYKRLCDVHDEETQSALKESGGDADFASFPENHRFQIPSEAHWRGARQAARDVGQALQYAMRSIETANPDKLFGIFGDAQWTNKDRLSDAILRDLIEHFSSLELTLANLPEDEMGNGYEYLIKQFADDSGHTAAEFYTNRTVVHLMTELLKPQPEESIYDPTCGSGGMLISCIAQLHRRGKEWRNIHLYGQERNLMTSSIARMNCFLHGIEDFRIERGDTLSDPKFVQGDKLQQFDLVLANPPYSIKQWDRDAFSRDPWGRNLYGTPPQGRADYAFWQHILCSLKHDTGRCAILFPHGILFRQEEADMRQKIIETDVIECIIGLGPNLFYNSPMEACIVICRTAKPKERRHTILFINALNEVTRERAQSFLTNKHVERIAAVYKTFKDESGFSKVVNIDEVRKQEWNLSIPLYVISEMNNVVSEVKETNSVACSLNAWLASRPELAEALKKTLPELRVPDLKTFLCCNDDFELLNSRNDWGHIRFGDVVENINETENNPLNAGIERFIGLEHLEPGSLHIGTWGDIADGTTFTRRCHPRQVLFGKRRAYQRKIAVAEFDAVVSGDIYVFGARADRLLLELLPFICSSERFFKYAIETSAGSLSPRTNWSSLAKFEFDLPPLDQQRRIAQILWSMENTAVAFADLKKYVRVAKESIEHDAFHLGEASDVSSPLPPNWCRGYLVDLALLDPRPPRDISGDRQVTFVPMSAVSEDGGIMTSEPRSYSQVRRGFTNFADGDVLFAKITPCTENGKGAIAENLENGIGFGSTEFFVFRPKISHDKFYVYYLTMSRAYRKQAARWMRGSAGQLRVPKEFFSQRYIAIPPQELRESFGNKLHQMDGTLKLSNKHVQRLLDARTKLINLLFS